MTQLGFADPLKYNVVVFVCGLSRKQSSETALSRRELRLRSSLVLTSAFGNIRQMATSILHDSRH